MYLCYYCVSFVIAISLIGDNLILSKIIYCFIGFFTFWMALQVDHCFLYLLITLFCFNNIGMVSHMDIFCCDLFIYVFICLI